jgi:hypothetical protein
MIGADNEDAIRVNGQPWWFLAKGRVTPSATFTTSISDWPTMEVIRTNIHKLILAEYIS